MRQSNECRWRCIVCHERRSERIKGDVGERWSVLVWGRGGLVGGWVKGYIGMGVRYGYGASGRRMCRGVEGEIREASQGDAKDGKMVVVEPAPEAKTCEVGREMD